jgi:thiosulfate dehydrogenase
MTGSSKIKIVGIIGLLALAVGVVIFYLHKPVKNQFINVADKITFHFPDTSTLASTPGAELIRYGRELIVNTAAYLGPRGVVKHISNGMNCGNCHLEGGTRLNGNCFAMVASTYPKFRNRSGKLESIEYRVNDCMERSLNGKKLDTVGREMQALVAYIKWLGKNVTKSTSIKGASIPEIPLLHRAASVDSGGPVYLKNCSRCHGANGLGILKPDSSGYIFPPLCGPNSYNVSAGIYMLSRFAGFVKYNMPFSTTQQIPVLTDAEAWDVAAYINSKERPGRMFKEDWPVIATKPFDYPFGPYADTFSVQQHKYGPFEIIKKAKEVK